MSEFPMSPAEFQACMGAHDDQVRDIALFRDLVIEWNERMNLVGPSFQLDFWRRHALDCAQLFHVEHLAQSWVDIGTGAGFPGVILAIFLKPSNGTVHLVESQAKKVTFLRMVCSELALPVVIHHARAEGIGKPPNVDVVTARACAPLSRLLNYASSFFSNGARGAFLKGASAAQEVVDARVQWDFSCETVNSLSASDGKILRIDGARRRA